MLVEESSNSRQSSAGKSVKEEEGIGRTGHIVNQNLALLVKTIQ
jgi:hypothetical protein